MQERKILLIGGPTGSGESTITKELVERHPVFQRLVTATSRPMRSGEIDAKNYYFFTKEEFEKKIKEGEIAEYTYVENRDVYYGTYKPDLLKKIQSGYLIINVDQVGVKYYKENYGALAIFLLPESINSLAERLKKRNPEITKEELQLRLENAQAEIDNEQKFYDYSVVNKDGKLEEAICEIEDILIKEGYKC